MKIEEIVIAFSSKKVLVVGDAMIDRYILGKINRVSPEAPVNIVDINKSEDRLGGAANVAVNIKSLGAHPILCSVIGDCEKKDLFYTLMKKNNLTTEGIFIQKDRINTVKTRIIANNKHQIRFDEEDKSDINIQEEFLEFIKDLIVNIDVIILQDYNKGVLTTNVIKKMLSHAKNYRIPIVVDPKEKNFHLYQGCSLFKPNLRELGLGMGINIDVDNLDSVKEITENFRRKIKADAILLTLSEKGICIKSSSSFYHIPAFDRDIIDITGAGDTVLAMAALCLTLKISNEDLAFLSCLAGGLACEQLGAGSININKFITSVNDIR